MERKKVFLGVATSSEEVSFGFGVWYCEDRLLLRFIRKLRKQEAQMKRKDFVQMMLPYVGKEVRGKIIKSEKTDKMVFLYIEKKGKHFALSHIGFKKCSLDCSLFVDFLLRQAKYFGDTPSYVNVYFDEFGIFIHKKAVCAGDLVFFSKNGDYPSHMGVMINENEYIHLLKIDGKRIVCRDEIVEEPINPNDPKKREPQIYFSDPIGYKRVTIKEGRYRVPFFK